MWCDEKGTPPLAFFLQTPSLFMGNHQTNLSQRHFNLPSTFQTQGREKQDRETYILEGAKEMLTP